MRAGSESPEVVAMLPPAPKPPPPPEPGRSPGLGLPEPPTAEQPTRAALHSDAITTGQAKNRVAVRYIGLPNTPRSSTRSAPPSEPVAKTLEKIRVLIG